MFAEWFVTDLVYIGLAIFLAKLAQVELGLRRPVLAGAWPWIGLYIAWYAAEWVVFTFVPAPEEEPDWVTALNALPLAQQLILTVVTGPIFEELLFRGVMFAALLRRWGIATAAIASSAIWAATHIGYETWFVFSIAGSGVVLALIRWKSGSLWPPLILHAAGNLIVTLDPSSWFGGAG